MKKIIVVLISILFLMPAFTMNARADSLVTVTVNPSLRDSIAGYSISFITTADLIGGKDDIIIKFPEGTTLPCSCPHNWHLEYFLINNYKPARVGKMSDVPNAMYLEIPGGITIKAGETVNVEIKSQANIWNPKTPGVYSLTLWTTKQGKMQSNEYEITSTQIQNLEVTVTPNTSNLIGAYNITFATGEKGNLYNGQNIYIQFPSGTVFPSIPHKNSIAVNGQEIRDVSIQENIMTITLAYSINKNRDTTIKIDGGFGLKNPPEKGIYTLNVWTDSEPEPVETKFEIKSQYIVFTQIATNPLSPDGYNNYYKTKPEITLTGETNTSETITTFYKLNEGTYSKYVDPFQIPEGIHTLYYYSKTDTYVEEEKSEEFKVDTTAPVINIEFPKDAPYYTGDESILIYGTLGEDAQLSIMQGFVNVKDDLTFAKEVMLDLGENTINISATDLAGNKTYQTITIILDTTVPMLSVTSPGEWDTIKTKEITVTGNVSPYNTEVYINNKKVSVSNNGEFAYSFVPEIKGSLIPIKVKAIYPLSRKSAEKTITVIYDPALFEVVFTVDSHTALVNNEQKKMDVAPFIDKSSNRTLVPVRFVTEFLGGEVSWDGEKREVTIQISGKEIKLQIGSSTAYVNGVAIKLDQPAIIKENRTFVPLRFVAETFGLIVNWDSNTRSIKINTP